MCPPSAVLAHAVPSPHLHLSWQIPAGTCRNHVTVSAHSGPGMGCSVTFTPLASLTAPDTISMWITPASASLAQSSPWATGCRLRLPLEAPQTPKPGS